MSGGYPEPPPRELTDDEVQQLAHELAEEWYLAPSNFHVLRYLEAKEAWRQAGKNEPFPEFDPSYLDDVFKTFVEKAEQHVRKKLNLKARATVPVTSNKT
jgi:hypothetical protein